jgi:serine/threonine-protein kinase
MPKGYSSSLLRKIFNRKNIFIALVLLASFVIIALLMDFIVMPWYTKHGKEFELPDVTDRKIEEAIVILEAADFKPLIQDSVYDEQFSPGSVIQQNPVPFSLVKKGRRVYLIVSIGEKPRYVPQLIGLTPQDAEFRLKEQALKLNQVFYEFSDFYPRGVVINQSIPAGEQVLKNKKVNITVSLGVAPTSLEIPNLLGKSLDTAEKELEAIDVRIGTVKFAFRPKLVPGTILRQSIAPGTSATNVDSLNLLVSSDQPPPEELKEDTLIQNQEPKNE